jgi:hypothetical protein
MPAENYTPRTVRALKETPDGHRPGEVFVVTQDVADVLTMPGVDCVEYADVEKPKAPQPSRHHRRDMRAEA